MEKTQLKIGSHAVELTHLERVLFPEDGITKAELIDYFRNIADVMVPHLKGRPLSMYRIHGNIEEEGYYQQNIPAGAPEWVNRVTVKKEGGTTTHIVCDNAATLVYLANQNCITPHIWLSRVDLLENPDQMIFDLDPPGDDFTVVNRGARLLKSILDELHLNSFLKTTGSHGLHVVVPLLPTENFETIHGIAQAIAGMMTQRDPELYTTEQRKDKRQGRLFIDILRNTYAHTAVAPYAVRAINGAPVAAPLFWEELEDRTLNSQKYNLHNILKHLGKNGDPWEKMEAKKQEIKGKIPNHKSI